MGHYYSPKVQELTLGSATFLCVHTGEVIGTVQMSQRVSQSVFPYQDPS